MSSAITSRLSYEDNGFNFWVCNTRECCRMCLWNVSYFRTINYTIIKWWYLYIVSNRYRCAKKILKNKKISSKKHQIVYLCMLSSILYPIHLIRSHEITILPAVIDFWLFWKIHFLCVKRRHPVVRLTLNLHFISIDSMFKSCKTLLLHIFPRLNVSYRIATLF